jgi:CheY-like chemotaxis protein
MGSLGRVLVVEDEDDIRTLYAVWLEESGFDVIEAHDGAEGISRAADQQPKAILMDVAMPRMNGLEATRRLRSDQATAQIPILIISAHTGVTEREGAFAAGADEFLGKPCDLELLTSRIRHYVSKGR